MGGLAGARGGQGADASTEFRITSQRFDLVYEQRRDSWGFAWSFATLIAGSVPVMPARNLVANIGFDDEANHTKLQSSNEASVPTHPLAHPSSTTPDADFERAVSAPLPAVAADRHRAPQRNQQLVRAALYRLAAAAARGGG